MLRAPMNSKRPGHLRVQVLCEFATATMHSSVCLRIKRCGQNPRTGKCTFKLWKGILPIPLRRSGKPQRIQETSIGPLELGTGIPTKAPATDDPVWGA